MTNNPTIDGVSRELLERILHGCMFTLSRQQHDELRALLDAAVAERQPVEFPAGAIHNGRAFIDQLESIYAFKEQQGHPLSLCSEWQELVRCFEWLATHATDAHSTITQLQGRIAELECARGEPVAWRGLNSIGDIVTEWIDGSPPEKLYDLCGNEAAYDKVELAYFAPPAPVAVALPERKIVDNKTSTRDYVMGCGWNACLEATVALNEVKL